MADLAGRRRVLTAGLGGMGFTPASQGGTHIVERNLTRLTIVVASIFFAINPVSA